MEMVFIVAGIAAVTVVGFVILPRRANKSGAPVERTSAAQHIAPSSQSEKGIPLNIRYADGDGEVTSRRIDLSEIREEHYEGLLRPRLIMTGWCYQRRDWSEFVVARIELLTDLRTDEVYDTADAIAGYLRLIAPGAMASLADRVSEGYREIDWAKRDRKLILTPLNATIDWRFSNGTATPKIMKVWITGAAIRPNGQAYAVFAEPIGGASEERPYFTKPLGTGHREVLAIEVEDRKYEGDAIVAWAEERFRKPD